MLELVELLDGDFLGSAGVDHGRNGAGVGDPAETSYGRVTVFYENLAGSAHSRDCCSHGRVTR